jgi:ABC-type multidrug transport system ATPase subunit
VAGDAFECERLSKSFGRRRVLDSLNLSVGSGETIGLLGANGAGKTTLLQILLGNVEKSVSSIIGAAQPDC